MFQGKNKIIKVRLRNNPPVFISGITVLLFGIFALIHYLTGIIYNLLLPFLICSITFLNIINAYILYYSIRQSYMLSFELVSEYFNNQKSLVNIIESSGLIISAVMLSLLIKPANYTDVNILTFLIPVTLIFISNTIIIRIENSQEIFHIEGLNLVKDLWKRYKRLNRFYIVYLIVIIVLDLIKYNILNYVDYIFSIIVLVYSLVLAGRELKSDINQVLSINLPESLQYDVLTEITNNIHRICEYKGYRINKHGRNLIVDIDVKLPYDSTVEDAHNIEKEISGKIREKYNNTETYLHIITCDRTCIYGDLHTCPVKAAGQQNKRIND